jgi:predicted RNase H-like HicB family nuclease
MTRKYPVIFEWAGKNFGGYAPDVPGCIATAKTLEQMRTMLKGALEAHLQWLEDDGDPIPTASAKVTVDMKPDSEFKQPRGYHVVVEQLEVTLPKKKRTLAAKTSLRELSTA